MSKDLLLQYAKGSDLEQKYAIVYEAVDNKAIIASCQPIQLDENVFIRMILTDKGEDIPDNEVLEAAKEYMKNNPCETVLDIDLRGMGDMTFDF